jgi:hypothetical protein
LQEAAERKHNVVGDEIFNMMFAKILLKILMVSAWLNSAQSQCNEVVDNLGYSIPKVVGSIPTVAKHIFQACQVWIYTQSDITSITFICF